MADLFTGANLAAFATLLLLEIVLGVDNVIFISILSNKLPANQRARARTTGIALAVITRIILLLSITYIMRLTAPWITILGRGLSGRDLILIVGGLFLIGKSVHEMHDKLEAAEHVEGRAQRTHASFTSVIIQIILMDIIFSLDSVITAVGISGNLPIMITAVVASAFVMVIFAGPISDFVERHPTMKMLALSFLILIGVVLVIEGWNADLAHEMHLKNYVYFAMAFAFVMEMLNMRLRRSPEPVKLKNQPVLQPPMLPDTNIEMAGDIY